MKKTVLSALAASLLAASLCLPAFAATPNGWSNGSMNGSMNGALNGWSNGALNGWSNGALNGSNNGALKGEENHRAMSGAPLKQVQVRLPK